MGVTLRDDDQLVTTYRGLHDLIGKGVPLEEIYGEMMGRTVGASRGKGGTMHIAKPEKGVMLSTGIVGAGPPVGCRAGDVRQAQGAGPRHGGQLRRRRDEHRVVPRSGEHGRAVGSADGLRLPEQPVRRDDADRRHDEDRTCRRPCGRLRNARCPRRRQRSACGRGCARRGDRQGPQRRRTDLHRVRDVPFPRPLLRRPDALHPQGTTGSRDGRRSGARASAARSSTAALPPTRSSAASTKVR